MPKVRAPSAPVKVQHEEPPTKPRPLLRFGNGNAKLDQAILTMSLPAGHFCPFAERCLAKAARTTGRITDGPDTEFRCYAATGEARSTEARRWRWGNAGLLRRCKSTPEMVGLILESLTPLAGYVRVHESGDFFSDRYFRAWLEVARQRPRTVVYGYTKALPFWVRWLDEVGTGHEPGAVPNFILTASYGGTHDPLIGEHGLRYARVVYSPAEAQLAALELDHDDSHAYGHGPDFALLVHGTQPPRSEAGQAVMRLRRQGQHGYHRRPGRVSLL